MRVTGERMYPILPCPDLAEAVEFYLALGFGETYRQTRPNPYAVVSRGDMAVHLAEITGYDPATSVSSAIVVVPGLAELRDDFAAGLRAAYGRVPVAGVPRLLGLRRKAGTATGFSVVDIGGNWLRFYAAGEDEQAEPRSTGLTRVLEVAARQGDARGDEEQALLVLEAGLRRHPDAGAEEIAEVQAYRAELLLRLGRPED